MDKNIAIPSQYHRYFFGLKLLNLSNKIVKRIKFGKTNSLKKKRKKSRVYCFAIWMQTLSI